MEQIYATSDFAVFGLQGTLPHWPVVINDIQEVFILVILLNGGQLWVIRGASNLQMDPGKTKKSPAKFSEWQVVGRGECVYPQCLLCLDLNHTTLGSAKKCHSVSVCSPCSWHSLSYSCLPTWSLFTWQGFPNDWNPEQWWRWQQSFSTASSVPHTILSMY